MFVKSHQPLGLPVTMGFSVGQSFEVRRECPEQYRGGGTDVSDDGERSIGSGTAGLSELFDGESGWAAEVGRWAVAVWAVAVTAVAVATGSV